MVTNKKKGVEFDSFVKEIGDDIPTLMVDYPEGVYITHLLEYYGESISKIMRAVKTLEKQGKVELHRNVSNALYLIPVDYKVPAAILSLSPLQRKLLCIIIEVSKYNERVKKTPIWETSLAHICRAVPCSMGGLHNALTTLTRLGLVSRIGLTSAGKMASLRLMFNNDAYSIWLRESKNGEAVQSDAGSDSSDKGSEGISVSSHGQL